MPLKKRAIQLNSNELRVKKIFRCRQRRGNFSEADRNLRNVI